MKKTKFLAIVILVAVISATSFISTAKPSGKYVSPTGYVDVNEDWINPSNAIDGKWGSYASNNDFYDWLELTFPTVTVDRVKLKVNLFPSDDPLFVPAVGVEILNKATNQWDTVYSGTLSNFDVHEITIPSTLSDKVRFTAFSDTYYLYELQIHIA